MKEWGTRRRQAVGRVGDGEASGGTVTEASRWGQYRPITQVSGWGLLLRIMMGLEWEICWSQTREGSVSEEIESSLIDRALVLVVELLVEGIRTSTIEVLDMLTLTLTRTHDRIPTEEDEDAHIPMAVIAGVTALRHPQAPLPAPARRPQALTNPPAPYLTMTTFATNNFPLPKSRSWIGSTILTSPSRAVWSPTLNKRSRLPNGKIQSKSRLI